MKKTFLIAGIFSTALSFAASADPLTITSNTPVNISGQTIATNGPVNITAPEINLTNTIIKTPHPLTITANVPDKIYGDAALAQPYGFNPSHGGPVIFVNVERNNPTAIQGGPAMAIPSYEITAVQGTAVPIDRINDVSRIGERLKNAKPIIVGGNADQASQLAQLAPSAGGMDIDAGTADMYNFANQKLQQLPTNGY